MMITKKLILLVGILIFFIAVPTSFGFLFDDDFEEHTTSISISNLTTQIINHTDGCYVYTANFKINELSSKHDIEVETSFWNETDIVYSDYALDAKEKVKNSTENLGYKSQNPHLNPIKISSKIERENYTVVTQVKISIIDKTDNKLIYKTVEPFTMKNQKLVNDTLDSIVGVSIIDAQYSMDSSDFNFFKKVDLDKNNLITFDEFEKLGNTERFSYLESYSSDELKEEFDAIDANNDNYLTITEFETFL